MAKEKTYDLIVIGAGPGGYVAAIRAAQLGMNVALVDRRRALGGTCLNIGCIPSKALLESSELYARARGDLKDHGIEVGETKLDLAALMKRKQAVVDRLTAGVGQLMKAHGVDVLRGSGRLKQAGSVEITDGDDGGRTVKGERILIATGSEPQELPFAPFDGDRVIDSENALALEAVPSRLLVIGAGAIGLEMGSVWRRLGAEVTVIEILPAVLPGWDADLSRGLARELGRQGLAFELGTRVEKVDVGKRGVRIEASRADSEERLELEGDRILVAVGRRPYTEALGLEEAGVEREEDGRRVRIDERFQTSVPGIFAIGDVVRGAMLAHKAEDEGIAAVELMAGKAGHVNYEAIPNVVYTAPEVASVGATEQTLKDAGVPYRKGRFPFAANGRALAMGDSAGFVKILAREKTDRILGVHILGPQASTLIAEAVAVMEFGGSAEDIARTVAAHPTLAEAVREAALAVDGRAIHRK